MKHILTRSVLFACLFFPFLLCAQINEKLNTKGLSLDTIKRRKELADSLSKPYNDLQKLFRYQDPILYLSILPQFDPTKTRSIPLQDAEGSKGYWAEGNIAHRISLYRGKYYSIPFFKKLRFTFDAAFMLRMTKDESSPLLPTSNEVGFGADYFLGKVENITKNNKNSYWLKMQLHHYSNGQAAPFYYMSTPGRNNYKNGDFSTNYLRAVIYGMRRVNEDHLFTASLGYQRELNIGGPLTISTEMNKSYGFNRALATLQWLKESKYELQYDEKEQLTERSSTGEYRFRTEISYIMDRDLSLFPFTKKYRFGIHNYFTYRPWATSDIGLVAHHYYGRDYLNIRYDDIVNSYQLGLVLNFNK